MDFFWFSTHECEEYVEVVDHHVEHDADVDRTERHRAHAVDLDEARTNRARSNEFAYGDHHRVVSNNMTNLQECTRAARGVRDRTRF